MLSRVPLRLARAAQGVAFSAKPRAPPLDFVRADSVFVAAESTPKDILMSTHTRPNPATIAAAGKAKLGSKEHSRRLSAAGKGLLGQLAAGQGKGEALGAGPGVHGGGRLSDIMLVTGTVAAVASVLIAQCMFTDSRIAASELRVAQNLDVRVTQLEQVVAKNEMATKQGMEKLEKAIEKQGKASEKQGKETKEGMEKLGKELGDKMEKQGSKNAEALAAIARLEVGQQVAAGGFLLLVLGGVLHATRNN